MSGAPVVARDTAAHPTAVDARLALPAGVGWLAAVLLVALPQAALATSVIALAAALSSVLVVRRAARRPRVPGLVRALLPSVVAVGVVAAAIALAAPARIPPLLADLGEEGGSAVGVVALEATVAPGAEGGADATLLVLEDRGTGEELGMRVPVRLLQVPAEERLALGTRLDARWRVLPTEAGDDRAALLAPMGAVTVGGAAPPLLSAADDLRARFLDVAGVFRGDGAALLPGLAIGDTSAVSDELDDAMKASSLSHLTAVSGANCAIVVGLVMGAGALAGWPRPVRIGVALAALGGFVLLVTPEPSVVRAAVMAAVVLVALAGGRPGRGLPVLGAAVLGILVLDPWTSREYGFVLSVLATAALLLLAGPLAERLGRVMPAPLALAIAVPLAAQIACQPVLVLLEPSIPLAGVAANILAAPAAPVATIVGMLACLLAPVAPPFALGAAGIAWLPASWIGGIARVAAELPGAQLPWPEGGAGAVLLAVVIAGLLGAAGVPPVLGRRGRRRALAATSGLLAVTAGLTVGTATLQGFGRPSDWTIAQCDIGQGDAVLVRSAGEIALIDTGAEPELLDACLRTLGIDRLDLLVLTHFDHDHVGAVDVVVGRVDEVIAGPLADERDAEILDALAAGGAVVRPVAAGEQGMLGAQSWRVLWPPDHRGIEPGNDASLVLEWRAAGECSVACAPSMLALGDLGQEAQRGLLAAVRIRAVSVVKVSHHGSADQEPELYRAAAATLGLIGVGEGNTYGHPAPEALDAVTAAGGTPVRSDAHGLVLIAPEPGRPDVWRVWTERGELDRGG
ncbi:ComEC/Rec2 family competence protein [Microcella daejeonensis]|uniref:ComEC/Rec2 family competence protein n=1 Tax=Microcella daejeonensis TaxID=2994971 RepID=A0A9E8ML42_9MICO|nr:ComEC/Rec2 family competence protein [Microcella daejeonensis]WAB81047.1 ComEC/Rec2 family competence protein [Microcella daejeonensis]